MNRVVSRFKRDEGATLPLFALMALVLFGMVGFAVDLGWVYLNASRVQNAADAAALAAVTRLPTVTPTIAGSQAEALAYDLADDNGYPAPNVAVENVRLDANNPASRFNDYQVRVAVTDDVETFFVRVFGVNSMTVTRDAIAESLPPLALGGNSNVFGVGRSGPGDGFWAAINGKLDKYENGDPFSSDNPGAQGSNDQGVDSIRNARAAAGLDGYYYALDVPAGAGDITVYVIDGEADGQDRYDDRVEPLDTNGNINTTFRVNRADSTPFDYTDNPNIGACNRTFSSGGSGVYPSNITLNPFDATSPVVDVLCTIPNTSEGIYPLHVTANNGGGRNSFGLAVANSGAGTVRIYGLGSMSLSNTINGGTSTDDLMRVPEEYAGRTIKASFFDPGDVQGGTGNTTMSVSPDAAGLPCRITRGDTDTFVGNDVGNCFVNTQVGGNRAYSGEWVHMTFDLPPTYTCASNCWWRISNTVPAGVDATDRTTWLVEVEGNPVHLIR